MNLNATNNLAIQPEQLFKVSDKARDLGLVVRYDTIKYRGEEINFLSDLSGVQCFAQWKDQLIDLGLNNIYYKEDICKFIDRQLDLISDFRDSPDFTGAKLEWFHNGDYRDIRLSYKGRVLKVFLNLEKDFNETLLISESKQILQNYIF